MNSLRVIRFTKHTVFKKAFLTAHEVETMQFVSQNTASIPIPKLTDNWPMSQGTEGIIMEFIQGRPLETVWPSLNDDQKSHRSRRAKSRIHFRTMLSHSAKIFVGSNLLFKWRPLVSICSFWDNSVAHSTLNRSLMNSVSRGLLCSLGTLLRVLRLM